MKPRKLVMLSADRFDRARIVLNCCERLIIIGCVSVPITNSIHNSQSKNAVESTDRDRDYTSNFRALPLIVERISPFS